ncbi:MAG: helix-turn-helix domain-containing protein [Opitutaceae bacterium]|nr:helix-turn-helix domain-containing protein [Opitutaceae bacterium]
MTERPKKPPACIRIRLQQLTAAQRAEAEAMTLRLAREEADQPCRLVRARVKAALGYVLSYEISIALLLKHRLLKRHVAPMSASVPGARRRRQSASEADLLAGRPVGPVRLRKLLVDNPALRERGRETQKPGERVCLFHSPVALPEGRLFLHATVDTFGGVATGEFYRDVTMATALGFLETVALPFYARNRRSISQVETGRTSTYCGYIDNRFEAHVRQRHGIVQEIRSREMPPMNGHAERFFRIFESGFAEPRRQAGALSVRCGRATQAEVCRLRGELAQWLARYNAETPLEGYRNAGLPPLRFWAAGAAAFTARPEPS